jgi:hypothetical protein
MRSEEFETPPSKGDQMREVGSMYGNVASSSRRWRKLAAFHSATDPSDTGTIAGRMMLRMLGVLRRV